MCMFLVSPVKSPAAPRSGIWSKHFLMAPRRRPSQLYLVERCRRFRRKNWTVSLALSPKVKRRADHESIWKPCARALVLDRLLHQGNVISGVVGRFGIRAARPLRSFAASHVGTRDCRLAGPSAADARASFLAFLHARQCG